MRGRTTVHKMRLFAVAVAAAVIFMSACAVPSADAAYTAGDVTVYPFSESGNVLAGGSTDIQIALTNNGSGTASYRISVSEKYPLSSSMDVASGTLGPGKNTISTITITSDKYADHESYVIDVTVSVFDFSTEKDSSVTVPMNITVDSAYVTDNSFNKILGIFDNPLDHPFNTPLATAIITLVLWLLITFAALALFSLILSKTFHTTDEEHRSLMRKTGSMLTIALIIHGITEALLVYGANSFVVATFKEITNILYIILLTYTAWNIYDNVIRHTFHKMEREGRVADADSTVIPLLELIGKVVIGVIGLAFLLSSLGFSLVAILAGAGVITVAISLGAQNTLTEMFAGISLLMTRPFKKGDMVNIGSDDAIYEVIRVRLMNTEFKNWINLEHVTMPNSTVSKSNITNITGNTSVYRLFLYYGVAYECDLELARKTILDTAYAHPQVITDGSYSKPDLRLTNFDDYAIEYRLAVYIKDFRDSVTVSDELNEAVYKALESNDVEVPYDKYDMYLKEA